MTSDADPLPRSARWVAAAFLGAIGVVGIVHGLAGSPGVVIDRAGMLALGSIEQAGQASPPSTPALPPGDEAPDRSIVRRINVNTASSAELQLLPGVGPTIAGNILADREANGPYASLGDLDRVPRIGPKTIANLTPYATVD